MHCWRALSPLAKHCPLLMIARHLAVLHLVPVVERADRRAGERNSSELAGEAQVFALQLHEHAGALRPRKALVLGHGWARGARAVFRLLGKRQSGLRIFECLNDWHVVGNHHADQTKRTDPRDAARHHWFALLGPRKTGRPRRSKLHCTE